MSRLSEGRSSKNGLTLIELMAVLALAGLVAGTVALRLSVVHEDVELRSAAEAIRELDRRARLHAQTGTRVLMAVGTRPRGPFDESASIVLIDLSERTAVGRVDLPGDAIVSLHAAGGKDEIVFDRTGRSGDYSVGLNRGQHAIEWSVRGLTGEHVRKENVR